jgi:methionyl aminopeptidase
MEDSVYESYIQAGKVSAKARDRGISRIKAGVSYLEVAQEATDHIEANADGLAFPVNISVNEIAAHYTPTHDDDLVFSVGDLVKFDVGAQVDGYIGDTAATVEVGTSNLGRLIEASREALMTAIALIRPGVEITRIGESIQNTIESMGYNPIRNLTGHQLGQYSLHGNLAIPNVRDGSKDVVQEDQVFAVEPFATTGHGLVKDYKRSNIYRFLKKKEFTDEAMSTLIDHVEPTRGLPFSERFAYTALEKPEKPLRRLVAKGCLHSYAQLREISGGMVSQAEHTVLVTGSETVVTTN